MLEVFTTNIKEKAQAEAVLKALGSDFPDIKINFDFEYLDSEKPFCHSILRLEGENIFAEKVIEIVNQSGFKSAILEDKICTN